MNLSPLTYGEHHHSSPDASRPIAHDDTQTSVVDGLRSYEITTEREDPDPDTLMQLHALYVELWEAGAASGLIPIDAPKTYSDGFNEKAAFDAVHNLISSLQQARSTTRQEN